MTPDTLADLARRFASEVLDPLKHAYVGKDEIIDLMGVSLAARENLFLYGPPGTAKSALVRAERTLRSLRHPAAA
jgi:MoxR-like ATPase